MASSLQVALKEWQVICDALAGGQQMILLRKGGILEAIGGFELEHRGFLLFPTYVHQNLEMLKPDAQKGVEKRATEPAEITLSAAGEVTDILRLQSRQQMDRLDGEHLWTAPLIDMRFNYRPQNPLYLLIVRAHRLRQPVTIANTPEYAGCKSWVPLDRAIETGGGAPAIDDAQFAERRQRILDRVAQPIA